MGLSENLKSIRKKQKITQRKLAELTGISYSMISKLESGEQKNPSLSTLQLIAEQLHVSVSQLLNGEDLFTQFDIIMGDATKLLKKEVEELEPRHCVKHKLCEFLSDKKVEEYFSIGMIAPEDYDDIINSIMDFIGYQFSKYDNSK